MTDRAPAADGVRPRAGGVAAALIVDAALVVTFSLSGRASHAEGLDAAGVWGTAWPFLAGLVVGWLVTRAWRHPLAPWPTGVVTWAATLSVGLLLRVVSGSGIALAFVAVAAVTLALLLVGWRVIASIIGRLRLRRAAATAASTEARPA